MPIPSSPAQAPLVAPPPGPTSSTCTVDRAAVQQGVASWYGARHHGQRTASGEVFDMYALTAAHRSLPFGTRLRVTNLDNGRSSVVRVNDRGPFADGRILDVSYRAAQDLDFSGQGLATIRLEPLLDCAQTPTE